MFPVRSRAPHVSTVTSGHLGTPLALSWANSKFECGASVRRPWGMGPNYSRSHGWQEITLRECTTATNPIATAVAQGAAFRF